MGAFVGVDWGGGAHAVYVIDARGMVLDRFEADRAGVGGGNTGRSERRAAAEGATIRKLYSRPGYCYTRD